MGQATQPSITKLQYHSPIPFAPKTYVCQQPIDSIIIDGMDTEASWQELAWSSDFVDIEGSLKPLPNLQTNMKMMWDGSYFYFFAKMEEPHIWAKLTERDAVIYQDDDFEIFIDPDGDAHNYYEFEINALNTIWDLFMMWPYRHQRSPNYLFNWNVDGVKHAVHVEGSLNDPSDKDEYWTIEMAIPWSALKEMAPNAQPPNPNDQWRINFSRVDWTMEYNSGSYIKVKDREGNNFPEDNWVWSPQGVIAMHMPEMWGYVQFAESSVSSAVPAFQHRPDEKIKWALWQLYFQQTAYHESEGKFLSDINRFTIPDVQACAFGPELYAGKHGFQFSAPSCNGKREWIIDQMGKIYSKKIHR
jgi:hypothetical protein